MIATTFFEGSPAPAQPCAAACSYNESEQKWCRPGLPPVVPLVSNVRIVFSSAKDLSPADLNAETGTDGISCQQDGSGKPEQKFLYAVLWARWN